MHMNDYAKSMTMVKINKPTKDNCGEKHSPEPSSGYHLQGRERRAAVAGYEW